MLRHRPGPGHPIARAARLGGVIVVVAGLLAACGGGVAGDATDSLESGPRPPLDTTTAPTTATPTEPSPTDSAWSPGPLDWQPCSLPRGGRCATLEVPLDWSDPQGPSIELALGRIPAEGESIGPLLINPGGPGASGLEFLGADPVTDEVAERFDLVSWDPRGVGGSADLACGSGVDAFLALDPEPDDDAEQSALDRAAAAVADECAATDAEVLAHVGTVDVARDMEAIRRALGAEQLNYLGFSYGTAIGQEYLRQFPDRVRAMVLDGLVDPAPGYEDVLITQAAAFDEAFDANARACAAAGARRCGVEDLGDAYDRLAVEVETRPLPGGVRDIGPGELATAAIQTTYGSDGWQELGPALAAALDGDGGPLWSLAASYYDAGDFTSYAAVVCLDEPPPGGAEAYRRFAQRAAARAPRFGAAVANELAVCAEWPVSAGADAPDTTPAEAPPVLVVGNTGDPATPYANAVAVAEALPGAVLLTVERDGHTAYLSDTCASLRVDRYLIDLELPPPGTTCG